MSTNPLFPRAVVFDLDGTLVDSAQDIARAINAGFEVLGTPPFTVQDVHRLVGEGAIVAINRAASEAGVSLTEEKRTLVLERFFAKYREVSAEGNGLYPGARELLTTLRARGVKTALCTNKAEPVAHIAVKALGIADLLDVVVGARDDRPRKPFPDMVHACIDPVGVAAGEAVMIGDSKADLGAARAAGVPIVLTRFGYSTIPIEELKPDAIVDHLDHVINVLPRVMRR